MNEMCGRDFDRSQHLLQLHLLHDIHTVYHLTLNQTVHAHPCCAIHKWCQQRLHTVSTRFDVREPILCLQRVIHSMVTLISSDAAMQDFCELGLMFVFEAVLCVCVCVYVCVCV